MITVKGTRYIPRFSIKKPARSWNSGPQIMVGKTPGAYAETDMNNGNIKIDKTLIKILEGGKKLQTTEEGHIFLVYQTILHEGQHEAEFLFNKSLLKEGEEYEANNTANEAGLVYEQKAMGEIITYDNADKLSNQNNLDREIDNLVKDENPKSENKGGQQPKTKKMSELLNVKIPQKK